MNDVQIFNNPDFGDIRTILINGEPWWVGKEIAKALEYKNTRDALAKHVDSDDKGVAECDTLGGKQNFTIINESGLYSLILSSKLPSAKKFKRWITSEVLPALRKTGKYETRASEIAEQRQLTVDDYIRAAGIIAGCRNERMPVVMALLEKSGIAVPRLEAISGIVNDYSDRDMTGETASMINMAINEYGMNMTQIGKLCGLQATQIQRIRTGQQKPKRDRAKVIQDAIRREIEK